MILFRARTLHPRPKQLIAAGVAATGALERSREVALDYAREARESLNGGLHREQLESLADAVVDRKR